MELKQKVKQLFQKNKITTPISTHQVEILVTKHSNFATIQWEVSAFVGNKQITSLVKTVRKPDEKSLTAKKNEGLDVTVAEYKEILKNNGKPARSETRAFKDKEEAIHIAKFEIKRLIEKSAHLAQKVENVDPATWATKVYQNPSKYQKETAKRQLV